MWSIALTAVISVFFIMTAIKTEKAVTQMEKMMTVMALSMLAGLTAGVTAGGLHHGEFASSLLYGISAGTLTGTAAGLPFKGLAVTEGAFTGGMAGMMGAMTAEMLSRGAASAAILVSLLLTGAAFLWTCQWLESRQQLKERASKNAEKAGRNFSFPRLALSCIFLAAVFTVYLLFPLLPSHETESGNTGHEHSLDESGRTVLS
ncbi:hypothetical protein [Alteribacter natronophilus]|uniref:hypothetical protein n=1 Tax=Alteribacter natronophilus TaxID=2583810 RepID=UPI00110E5F97|nr:hypothetical protein [Alteribacter natronophilus]TMW70158.1 hypothetical protein FGB90_18525 [Alteribacter natronophilus]